MSNLQPGILILIANKEIKRRQHHDEAHEVPNDGDNLVKGRPNRMMRNGELLEDAVQVLAHLILEVAIAVLVDVIVMMHFFDQLVSFASVFLDHDFYRP